MFRIPRYASRFPPIRIYVGKPIEITILRGDNSTIPHRALDDRARNRARGNAGRLLSPPRQRDPALDHADEPAVAALENELNELIRTHARFADRTVLGIRATAVDFVRYRIRSMDAIRRPTKEARKFPIDDLRKIEKKNFPALSFTIELFDHLPVNVQNECSEDKVRCAEIDIPRALTNLAPQLTGLTGLLRPGQKMRNWIQHERAKGLSKIPPYAPYLVPALSSSPWLPDVTEHRDSHEYWTKNSRQAKRKLVPQELPVQSWLLYHMRFLMAGECCSAFVVFGGLCAQLNLISDVLNLCVTESAGLGLTYSRISSSRLGESARRRIIDPAEFSNLSSSEQLGVKEQARRELALASRGKGGYGQPTGVENRPANRPLTLNSGASHGASASAPPQNFRGRRRRQSFRTDQRA